MIKLYLKIVLWEKFGEIYFFKLSVHPPYLISWNLSKISFCYNIFISIKIKSVKVVIQNLIWKCIKCLRLKEKYCKTKTVYFGKFLAPPAKKKKKDKISIKNYSDDSMIKDSSFNELQSKKYLLTVFFIVKSSDILRK